MHVPKTRSGLVLVLLFVACAPVLAQELQAGTAVRDITPQSPVPMWGYGDRHALLSKGVMDPLYAKALVLEAGEARIAIVTTDIGRAPTEAIMQRIRPAALEKAGVQHVLISGSHTHHGPVIEMIDEAGKGKGTFDAAVAYTKTYEAALIDVIVEAAGNLEPARIGYGSSQVDLNRNRQAKVEPKPRETELTVVRVDAATGNTLATIVNFAAHPTMQPGEDLRFSADYCGWMMKTVEESVAGQCMFVQGAAGDMSVQAPQEASTPELYGKVLAAEVLKVASGIQTTSPETPSIQFTEHTFEGKSRVDLANPMIQTLLKSAFFDEFVEAFMVELRGETIRPVLSTALINREIYFVGVSGEFFSSHSVRLKQRIRGAQVVFQGYCNGHHLYFPTIEQAAQGGYGADATVSWVPLGMGEEMMNQAVIDYYTMRGELKSGMP
ncbi:MAG: hypothetical protein AMXMBFR84_24790 [Candidatus Hydrogenedentota bacterium]